MSSYIKVLWPIVVGGQIAKAGELIEVTDAEARLLISLGKAERAEAVPDKVEAEPAEAVPDEVEAEPAEVEAEPAVRTKGKRNAASGL